MTSTHPRSLSARPAGASAAFRKTCRPLLAGASWLGGLALLSASARAQAELVTFSVDYQGPLNGVDATGSAIEIAESDILSVAGGVPAFGPLPPPMLVWSGAALGLQQYSSCVSTPGNPCHIEVDALSDGRDSLLPNQLDFPYNIYFSTDEYAVGAAFGPLPTIANEAPFGEICADSWVAVFRNPGPIPASAPPPPIPNTLTFDGDGESGSAPFQSVARGLGLIEPNVPGTGLPTNPFDLGDNLDALNIDSDPNASRVYFSLDAGFFDPLVGRFNSDSAAANGGHSGADVLVRTFGGAAPTVFAAAGQLGLGSLDDLDALILHENGNNLFEPSLVPYDWVTGTRDMLIFSVRRGSAVIGQIDSIQGIPIMPGDLLVPPLGGPDPGINPGILIPAEALGLSSGRSGGSADDIDALDVDTDPPYHDCNDNGIDDSVDIANGGSCDDNMNGIPDECEPPGTGYCFCAVGQGPCGNDFLSGGCENSTGLGARLEGTGSSSVFADDLVLTITQLPVGQFGIFYMGGAQISAPFGDGRRCVGARSVGTHRFGIQSSGGSATLIEGPGIVAGACANFPASGCIVVGATWHFQGWYRDPGGPCGFAHNLSNAWSVVFTD